ncbi:MAG: hypothetical protein MK165_16400 [Pirellulaceae bacterium]|nr:hypothetical protein [Pirellulaceae bacterium]
MKVSHVLATVVLLLAPMATPGFTEETSRWEMGTPIVTYWAGPHDLIMTDAVAQQMAEGNWNLCQIYSEGTRSREVGDLIDHYRSQLDILQRHGLRGFIWIPFGLEQRFGLDQQTELDAFIEGVKSHPALYGYLSRDEPNASMFADLAELKNYLDAKDPARLKYVNLYPNYASTEQLGTEGTPDVRPYEEHVRLFVETFKPQLLSYDHYHFGVKEDGDKYFLNLAQIRQAALAANIPFMSIVQACGWTVNMRIPTGEELRWLAYTSLAYGSQGISYYVYGYPGHDGGMINQTDGSPTMLYYAAREVNREFVAIATELQSLRSMGAYHAGMLPIGTKPLSATARFQLDPPVARKDPAVPVEGFLVGCFGKDQSPTHALVVNLDYRTYSGNGQPRREEFVKPVKRFLVGPGPLQIFDVTNSKWLPTESNRLELRLPPGAGVLVRLAE